MGLRFQEGKGGSFGYEIFMLRVKGDPIAQNNIILKKIHQILLRP